MSTKTVEPYEKISELLESLGGIPPERVLLRPTPGTATEKDLVAYIERTGGVCELVDGVLVEKPMGLLESMVASQIAAEIIFHLRKSKLGLVFGEAGSMRMLPGVVRAPDVSFVKWDKLPGCKAPSQPIADLYPDLAVEVLSKSNTKGEMERKVREYFLAGVSLIWLVDPARRNVRVYKAGGQEMTYTEADSLEGGDVLPGLSIPIALLFADLPDAPAP